jgi:hypothetical protein
VLLGVNVQYIWYEPTTSFVLEVILVPVEFVCLNAKVPATISPAEPRATVPAIYDEKFVPYIRVEIVDNVIVVVLFDTTNDDFVFEEVL